MRSAQVLILCFILTVVTAASAVPAADSVQSEDRDHQRLQVGHVLTPQRHSVSREPHPSSPRIVHTQDGQPHRMATWRDPDSVLDPEVPFSPSRDDALGIGADTFENPPAEVVDTAVPGECQCENCIRRRQLEADGHRFADGEEFWHMPGAELPPLGNSGDPYFDFSEPKVLMFREGRLEWGPPGGPLDDRAKVSVNLTGQLQIDFVTFNQSEANREKVGDMENAVGFRRSRLGMFGELFETTEYRIEYDFASTGRPRFLDNWVSIQDLPYLHNIIVGHFFEPFSLERYTPNRFATFMERSIVDMFAPARSTGLMFFGHSPAERTTWAVGAFRADTDTYGDAVGDSPAWAATAHLTFLPWYEGDGRLLHVGGSYSYRASETKELRFRDRPEVQLRALDKRDVPSFIDTGVIASDHHQLFGLEAAWVNGPLSIQSEVVYAPVNRLDGPDPSFYGSYIFASYFLTGENRSYSPTSILGRFREGIFQRITPHTNAFKGDVAAGNPRGIGAWEVAVRWSHVNLNDKDIEGGQLNSLTVGLNWYLNPNTRVTFNYIRPFLKMPGQNTSTADIIATRVGFEF